MASAGLCPSAQAEETQPYDYTITVNDDPDNLEDYLTNVSRLAVLQDDPPSTLAAVRQRLDVDLQRFENAMRSRGYYASHVVGEVKAPGNDGLARVTITVTPGPLYKIKAASIEYSDGEMLHERPRGIEDTGLVIGAAAAASPVLAGDARIQTALQRSGFPFAKVVDRLVIVDHSDQSMEVTYIAESGPWAKFGELVVSGNTEVKSDYFQKLRTWEVGTPYNEEEVRTFRRRLSESRLFRTIDLGPKPPLDEKQKVPIKLAVTEAPARTLSGGLSYATDSDFSAQGRWEHRNFLGRGELMRVNILAGFTEQTGSILFKKPYFLSDRQSLSASAMFGRKDYEAYSGYETNISVGLERDFLENWHASVGVMFDAGHLTWPEFIDDTYYDHALGGLPIQITRDGTDSVLDPTTGTRLSFGVTPFSGVVRDESATFASMNVTGSGYLPFFDTRLVIAARARVASIVGAELSHIPPNRRLYAGGGGSVRGFGYQMIGPLGPGDDPIGGRSAIDGGIEFRIKITETIGIVPFIEAGMVGEDSFPNFDETPRIGAGIGARYYTDFGPVRVDFGVPLNRRRQDDKWQIYVSLGQAF